MIQMEHYRVGISS